MKLHFGYSKSKDYGKTVFMSVLASSHIIEGEGINQWHKVEIDESDSEQINIAANMYQITWNCRYPKVQGADIHRLLNCAKNNGTYKRTTNYIYAASGKKAEEALKKIVSETGKSYGQIADEIEKIIDEINEDMLHVKTKLEKAGFIESKYNGTVISYTDKLRPVTPSEFTRIKELIQRRNYNQAISTYYQHFKDKVIRNDVFANELIFLKREAKAQLNALEIVAIYGLNPDNKIVSRYKKEFLNFINKQIKVRESKKLLTPLDILIEQVPTIEQMIEERKNDWHNSVYFSDGKIHRDNTPVSLDNFSIEYDKCIKGNIYKVFPDPIRRCEVWDVPESKKYWSLWTSINPITFKKNVTDRNLYLGHIDCVHPKEKSYRLIYGDEILSIKRNSDLTLSPVGGSTVVYTGNEYRIELKKYYEINVIRNDVDKAKKIGNVLIELIEEILRDAENELRERHGLPRIGEGWVLEMEMYNIIKKRYPDTEHHARPEWLKPQHLDVYVESHKLAFEYQGRQHYEEVQYFGGEEAFISTQTLDRRKEKLCRKNSVNLIYWKYDEPLSDRILDKKLR